jgi:nitrite reductase/ring-hydroxylating ferredoxin subunit
MAFVGKVSEIAPGRIVAVDVDGVQVAVANIDGRILAVADACTHRGCSLSEGELSGSVVTCPCHGGQFDLTSGAVMGGPPEEPVKSYAVSVAADELRVG